MMHLIIYIHFLLALFMLASYDWFKESKELYISKTEAFVLNTLAFIFIIIFTEFIVMYSLGLSYKNHITNLNKQRKL